MTAFVLLPGLDGTPTLFEPLIDALAAPSTTVQYPDALPSDYEALLPHVLNALPSDKPFILLGWSFSGPLALMAAATKPPGLLGVVLAASFVEKPLRSVPAFARFLLPSLAFRFSGSLAIAKTALAGAGTPELNALLRRAHSSTSATVMAARVRQVLTCDARVELEACTTSILYLGAEHDRLVPAHNADSIRTKNKRVQVRTIPGPHLALAMHAQEAASVLEEFAQECSRADCAQS